MRKDIVGYEGLYEVDTNGDVFHCARPTQARKTGITNAGYRMVQLWKNNKSKGITVHRLLACHFIPAIVDRPHVNHIDGDKLNNNLANLEWSNRKLNAKHAIATGLKVYTNRLTRDEFIEVLHEVIHGKSYAQMSEVVPYKVPFLSTKVRKIAKEEGLVNALDESLMKQRIARANKNLEVVNG